MTCNNRSENSDERSLEQQEHRHISRLWKKAVEKLNAPDPNFQSFLSDQQDDSRRNVRFQPCIKIPQSCDADSERPKLPSEAIQKKLARGKPTKLKSPLQKFDEVVTRELTIRRMNEEGMTPFDSCKKWSNAQFPSGNAPDFSRSKVSLDNKISRSALQGVEREVKDRDPSDVQDAALMEAIEKLAQAQAFCRFDAAVKAAEAATASVPLEMAEEVAVRCAKDYQSEIVDVINEKIPLSEEKKPIEVIGYIGVTKYKDSL